MLPRSRGVFVPLLLVVSGILSCSEQSDPLDDDPWLRRGSPRPATCERSGRDAGCDEVECEPTERCLYGYCVPEMCGEPFITRTDDDYYPFWGCFEDTRDVTEYSVFDGNRPPHEVLTCYPNLENFNVLYHVVDSRYLLRMPRMKTLSLQTIRGDLEFLRGMPLLEELRVWGDFVDLSPLSSVPNLVELELMGEPVVLNDLSALAELTNLEILRFRPMFSWRESVSGIAIDLTPLAGLSNLRDFVMRAPPGADPFSLAPLAGLRNVTTLEVRPSATGIETLVDLDSVETLSIEGVDLRDLSALATFPQLQRARVHGGVQRLGAVLSAASLQYLSAGYSITNLDDVSTVSVGPSVTLDLSCNPGFDLTPMVENPNFGPGELHIHSSVDCADQAANVAALRTRGIDVYDRNCEPDGFYNDCDSL